MKLIPDWRNAWRMFSVLAMTVASAIQGSWLLLDEAMRATLPPSLVHWLSLALLVAGIAGRLVDQPKTRGE